MLGTFPNLASPPRHRTIAARPTARSKSAVEYSPVAPGSSLSTPLMPFIATL